jgi:hypothetical protein
MGKTKTPRRCYYLSGPDLNDKRDGDRCREQATTTLMFAYQPDNCEYGYCDEHLPIAARAYRVFDVKENPAA